MRRLFAVLVCVASAAVSAAESICYGPTGQGRLENGVQLPATGKNFVPYSSLGVTLGRTYVHSRVHRIVVNSYASLAKTQPTKLYMYGETGWAGGGRFRPHRTHQNGLAVDFMVPVLDSEGRSVALPTSALNKFGYDIEFDANARHKDLVIDFEAIAHHLHALDVAARGERVGIKRVIFDPRYIPELYDTTRGDFIKKNIPFMQGKVWVRHDEHYHVDFAIPCKQFGDAH